MSRDTRAAFCIFGLFFASFAAYLGFIVHYQWVNAHIYPVTAGYVAWNILYLYVGVKWIGA